MDNFHKELLDFMVRTHIETQRNLRMLTPNIIVTTVDDAMTMLSDVRDYFMWMVIRATKENAHRVFDLLMEAGTYCQQLGDIYHQGFFLGLNQVIQLKFQVDRGEPGDENISYEDFMGSWEKTCSNLGLEICEP